MVEEEPYILPAQADDGMAVGQSMQLHPRDEDEEQRAPGDTIAVTEGMEGPDTDFATTNAVDNIMREGNAAVDLEAQQAYHSDSMLHFINLLCSPNPFSPLSNFSFLTAVFI